MAKNVMTAGGGSDSFSEETQFNMKDYLEAFYGLQNVQIKEEDNKVWLLILNHDCEAGGFFANKNLNMTDVNRYNLLPKAKALNTDFGPFGSTKYEMMVYWPQIPQKAIFYQTNDPESTAQSGYQAVDVSSTDTGQGAVRYYNSNTYYICTNTQAWHYAIGSASRWTGSPIYGNSSYNFPGPRDSAGNMPSVSKVQVWMRINSKTIVSSWKDELLKLIKKQ